MTTPNTQALTPQDTPEPAVAKPETVTEAVKAQSKPTKPKNRGGAPKGNANALRRGLKMTQLPKGAEYENRTLNQVRKEIESEVLASRGEVTLYDSALIQSAMRHEGRALYIGRLMREKAKELKTLDKVAMMKEVGNASDARDRCLKALDLDKRSTSDLLTLIGAATALPLEPADR